MVALDELQGEGWRRLLSAARRRLDVNGGRIEGTLNLPEISAAEHHVIVTVIGNQRPPMAGIARVGLPTLDTYLRNAFGIGLMDTLRQLEAVRAAARAVVVDSTPPGRHAGAPWFEAWLASAAGHAGTGPADLHYAIMVLNHLPTEGVTVTELAELAVGDRGALFRTPLAGLVLRALAGWQGVTAPTAAHTLWDSVGVVVDELASQVLVLNLPAVGDLLGSWLSDAAHIGLPVRLTLQQLRAYPPTPVATAVYVCDSTAMVQAAAAEFGPGSAALICTEGAASVAARRLVALCAAADAPIYWHTDFDWPGVRATTDAMARFGAQPWRMSAADYANRAGASADPLTGTPAPTPWDPGLGAAMTAAGRRLREEHLVDVLLPDLDRRDRFR